tara:strand:- start:3415 stop:4380 length:966 start_codon:yes stop_codon:yes gene_type:complete
MEKVSIIIPCKTIDDYTKECIENCLKLDYDNFEILVLSDNVEEYKKKDKRLKIIKTGESVPAEKRNIGMKIAEKSGADFYAFIDSDAYPGEDWLKRAREYLEKEKIGIVGGPNLTPPQGCFWEKVSGYVLANPLISGHVARRYSKKSKSKYVTELPSCNYIVKKEAASEYSGKFLTAEDTKFCLDCRKKGFKILYARDVVVWHHRRNSLKKHLKQMFFYGRDNLWLLKEEFGIDKLYLLVTIFGIIGLVSGIVLSLFFPIIKGFFLLFVGLYVLGVFLTSLHKNIKTSLAVFFTSIISHVTHGMGSFYGLFKKRKRVFNER